MRKLFAGLVLLLFAGQAHATHNFFFFNASNLSAGTIPNARLDPSSVTMQGSVLFLTSAAIGVTQGTYGTATSLPQLTVDVNGRVTAASNLAISLASGALCLNLLVTTNSTNATQIVITADYLDIMGFMAVNLSTTVDLSVVGPGGVDSAAGKQSSSWYGYYAISNDSGTFVGAIASTATGSSSSQPIIPAGYTKWRQLGRVRVNSSGNLIASKKVGNQVNYWTSQNVLNSGSNQSSYTDISLESIVSSAAINVMLSGLVGDASASFGKGARIQIKPKGCIDGAGPTPWYFGVWRGDATTGEQGMGFINLPFCGQRRLQYQQTGADDGNVDQVFMEVIGYQENIP